MPDKHKPDDDSAKTILVVEDEALIALNTESILKKHGYRVIIAYNGEKAVEKAEKEDIDLILMDIDLGAGRMDGTVAAEIILDRCDVPTVFLTGHSEKEMVDKVKGITMYGYVLKNAGEFVLLESIRMAFELFNAHREKVRSENRHKSLLQAVPDMMFVLDSAGTYIDYKPDDSAILEVPPEAFLGKNVANVLPKHIADQILFYLKETLTTNRTQLFEHEMVLGSETYKFETRMVPIDENHAVSIVRNITDQKQAEAERDRYLALLTNILDAVDSLLMVIDKEHHIIFCNWKDHEWVPPEVRGSQPLCYKVMKNFDKPCDYCPPMTTFRDGKTRWYEDRNPLDGSYKEISVVPIFNKQGEVDFVLENVRDVTERKRIEDSLKESEKRLQTIVDKLPIPIVISKGRSEEVVSVNRKFIELFGYTIDDMPDVGSWFESAYPEAQYRQRVFDAWEKRLQTASESNREIEPVSVYVTCKDGTVRYVSVRAFSLGDLHIVALIDLTE